MHSEAPSLSDASATANGHNHSAVAGQGVLALTIGAVGVVYGDIGTSPIYAFREAMISAVDTSGLITPHIVLGLLSLILWSLFIVVTLKYVVFLIRADNNGEGGTLALMALALRGVSRASPFIILLGIIAASLFYGNAVITPALSVLSAVEGLELVAPHLATFVIPLSLLILLALFLVQSRGTARVAALFGPIMVVWFAILAVAGVIHIAVNPSVLLAFSPHYGAMFLINHGVIGLVTLGAVFLAVTGAEALYADLGHFGRKPIQAAWVIMVLPALVLNYLGQGALILGNPGAIGGPFFLMFPEWLRLPMVVLATAATVIASQAVITGAYSLSRQAVQLGLLPRLEIRHTSEAQFGQIYVPRVNALLLVSVLVTTGLFRSSGALAGAAGIAVAGTMVVTTILAAIVVLRVWKWSEAATIALVAPLLFIDIAFLAANLLKIVHGGWFSLIFAAALMVLMLTWRRGSRVLFDKTRRLEVPLAELLASLEKHPPPRIAGTAVYLTGDPDSTPTALLHSLKHFKVLHDRNVIMTIKTVDSPRAPADERVSVENFSDSFIRITVRFGFMETPNLPKALAVARKEGFAFDIMSTTFFLSRRSLKAAPTRVMPAWQDKLFILLARNADDASSYFRLPTDRVVEIGTQVLV
jgi:KUP system potassium uptake protein